MAFFQYQLNTMHLVKGYQPITPMTVLNAYSKLDITEFVKHEAGQAFAPYQPRAVYNQAMQRYQIYQLPQLFLPWDNQTAHLLQPGGGTPPCDTDEAFFWGESKLTPPHQEPSFDPVLEDPVYEESPFLFDEDDNLVCMPAAYGTEKERMSMLLF